MPHTLPLEPSAEPPPRNAAPGNAAPGNAAPGSDPETPAALRLHHVSKRFAKRPAIIDLSLSVDPGSIHGLLGHNGAGKSTTLGMLLGQVYPDAGRVYVHGHDVFRHRRPALAKVGAIFESPCFYDYLSGLRNLRILAAYTGKVSRPQLDDTVELVGLGARVHDKVATYSHGMRQRLALAQALLPGPSTLLLDEPTDGLDPEGIAEFRRLIQRLNRERHLTILFSSHLLSEVEKLCDRVTVLHHGRKVFDGRWDAASPTAARRLELEVDRTDEAVGGLRAAGLLEPRPDPRGRLLLAGHTPPAAVNHWLVEHGFRVSRLGLVRASLEDFYLETITPPEAGSARTLSPEAPPVQMPAT
ncbi:MAG: ABC transporter ATP-binding protein [Planctomycetota bacterium]